MSTQPPDSPWGGFPPPPPPPPPPAYAPYPPAHQGGPGPVSIEHFRSLRGLAVAMSILLAMAAVLALVVIPLAINQRNVIHDHAFGSAFPADRAVRDAGQAVGAAAGFLVLVSIPIAVLFMIWMWRAAKNVRLFGRLRQKFGPGFAIGGWFIPMANFVIPGMQIHDIWKGSGPPLRPGDRAKGSPLVVVWWIAFILGRAVFLLPTHKAGTSYQLSSFDVVNVLVILGVTFTAASAVLAIFMIRGLTARQEEGAAALSAGVPPGYGGPPAYTQPGYANPGYPPAGYPPAAPPMHPAPPAPNSPPPASPPPPPAPEQSPGAE